MARKATVEGQLSSKTIHSTMRAQLHLPALHLSWALLSCACSTLLYNSAARQPIQLWEPSSTSLLFTSPGHCCPVLVSVLFYNSAARQPSRNESPALDISCPVLVSVLFTTQQQGNPSRYESPFSPLLFISPGLCSPVLVSVLFYSSAARQPIQLWESSSTSLPLISPGHWANIVKRRAEMVAPPSKQSCNVQTWNLQLTYESHNSAWFSHSFLYYHLTHPDTCK